MKKILSVLSGLTIAWTCTAQTPARPQQPQPPFPYVEKQVEFTNKTAGVTLSGTLTLPAKKGKFPLAILVSGSGPQDRNESLLGHQPFAVIADYLTRHGVAVLRYDDRGVGKSTGNFMTATSADFADDTEAAVAFALKQKNIDRNAIGIIGHSEGGLIAPMVATRNTNVHFVVMLAGPGLKGSEILLMQQELIGRVSGATEEELAEAKKLNGQIFAVMDAVQNTDSLKQQVISLLEKNFAELPDSLRPPKPDLVIKQTVNQLVTPWMRYFVQYDPYPTLTKVTCPLLAMNGKKDLQVPCEANIAAIRKALQEGGNSRGTYYELDDMNHLFQVCETGAPGEYMTIEQTFAPEALEILSNWINEQCKQTADK